VCFLPGGGGEGSGELPEIVRPLVVLDVLPLGVQPLGSQPQVNQEQPVGLWRTRRPQQKIFRFHVTMYIPASEEVQDRRACGWSSDES